VVTHEAGFTRRCLILHFLDYAAGLNASPLSSCKIFDCKHTLFLISEKTMLKFERPKVLHTVTRVQYSVLLPTRFHIHHWITPAHRRQHGYHVILWVATSTCWKYQVQVPLLYSNSLDVVGGVGGNIATHRFLKFESQGRDLQ
jgi:hypothetical protein